MCLIALVSVVAGHVRANLHCKPNCRFRTHVAGFSWTGTLKKDCYLESSKMEGKNHTRQFHCDGQLAFRAQKHVVEPKNNVGENWSRASIIQMIKSTKDLSFQSGQNSSNQTDGGRFLAPVLLLPPLSSPVARFRGCLNSERM